MSAPHRSLSAWLPTLLTLFGFIFDRMGDDGAQDVDEYVWAPGYGRLVEYLAAQPANVSQITAAELRFGSTGRVR